MIAPVALILFAIALALLGPIALCQGSWVQRSPALAVAAWQALVASLVLSVFLAGVTLAVPTIPLTADLASLLRACAMALRERYSTPGGAVVSGSGAVAAAVVLARFGYCLARELLQAARSRSRQWRALKSVGRQDATYGALVVDHATAAAYCMPGRGQRIVVTTAALAALDRAQLTAVLAHERAHQRGHHHLMLAVADAAHRAFPGVAAFREARDALRPLVELLADDAAAREGDRMTVATALVRLSEHAATPRVALGAGGESALLRVRRLVAPARPLGLRRSGLVALATAFLLAAPVALAVTPATAAVTMPPCPSSTSA